MLKFKAASAKTIHQKVQDIWIRPDMQAPSNKSADIITVFNMTFTRYLAKFKGPS